MVQELSSSTSPTAPPEQKFSGWFHDRKIAQRFNCWKNTNACEERDRQRTNVLYTEPGARSSELLLFNAAIVDRRRQI
ncbi:hypothetical protein BBJ29_000497 [Phytophthora kernoviae]|uniref:Uncharacterized protein n=1 Tax=Phytophthora kernoviae TaxID=325452 RepID=A0A3F2S458_9STRA|nr:hypothetical protein BBJ29_000497 [Phytophthora kernoviae]RLN69983.1 hypothetical protein BBP00_00000107 [Phytophthora kernoviae]